MSHEEERVVPKNPSTRTLEPVLAVMRAQGAVYSPVQKLAGGAWGAWLVRKEGGEVAILKCIWDSDWRLRLESARRVVKLLRARGAPVPRYLATGFDAEVGTWYVQERLEGTRAEELNSSLLGEVLDFIELQAWIGNELQDAYDWSEYVDDWMASRADLTMQVVTNQSREGAGLAQRLKGLVAAVGGRSHSADAVHGDFLATQLLVQSGRLSGVVDWDGAGRGDRCQDLALLFYNAFAQSDRLHRHLDPAVIATLGARALSLSGAERFGWFLAYEILLALAFVSQENPRHVTWRTQLGLRVLDAYSKTVRLQGGGSIFDVHPA